VRTIFFRPSLLSLALGAAACSSTGGGAPDTGSGGDQGSLGGTQGSGGVSSNGGASGTGGSEATGGSMASGGSQATGGSLASGGSQATGGSLASGGVSGRSGSGGTVSTGGANVTGGETSSGGRAGSGSGGRTGRGTGGTEQTGGRLGTGGQAGTLTGGTSASGGTTSTGTGGSSGSGGAPTGGSTSTDPDPVAVDCEAAMPTGGQQHSGNGRGGSGNLAWEIWTNSGSGRMTTFSVPAFSASWGGTGDYLARLGFEWGNSGKQYTAYGTITADFTFKKTGSGGGFSYIGIYGWSTNPCVEWYIIDDSFGTMPFTPWNSGSKGTATIDGETYKLFSNQTNGTGGSRCNQSSWSQFWSVRQKARQCGTITISDHFAAWDAAGMKLGNLLEAKILVETGGGSGSADFAIADVKTTQ
jgi:endo-1,4-beta-xylanase